MNWHWQNLNDDPKGKKKSGLLNGRAWFRFGKKGDKCVNPEWHFGGFGFGLEVQSGMDDDLQLHFQIPLVNLYLSFSGFLPRKWIPYNPRSTGIRIFGWAIWLTLWKDDFVYSSNQWKNWKEGFHYTFHILDFLFGRTEYHKEELETKPIKIPMLEGSYEGTVTFTRCHWKRSRLPFKLHQNVYADVILTKPIPFPGKGENSWDCGMDGLWGSHFVASRMEEAVGNIVESVMNSRRRYAGRYDWIPTKVEV